MVKISNGPSIRFPTGGVRRAKSHFLLHAAILVPALALGAGVAQAQNAGDDADGIVVTGRYQFLSADTSGTTNLPLAIEEVPQSISLVSNDFLNAADLRSLGEVAQYTPGAMFAGDQEGFGTIVKLRGFTAGTAFDGLTINDLNYEPDSATVERMEIVKGPSSVVYGQASPGGLINLVSKSATRSTPSYVSASGGSWDRWRLEGQLAGALDAAGSIRAIGVAVHEEAGSFLDIANSNKTVLYAGIDADLTSNVTAYVHGGYERYRRTSFDGIPTLADGSIVNLDRSFFIGSDDYNLTTKVWRANAGISWEVSPMWSIDLKTNYQNTKTVGPAPYAYSLQANGDFNFKIQNFLDRSDEDFAIGASSVYKLDDVGLDGSFVSVSAMYQSADSYTLQNQPYFGSTTTGAANIYDGVDAITAALNAASFAGATNRSSERKLKFLTLSGQAYIKPTDKLSLLLGLSYAKPDIKSQANSDPVQDYSGDSQMSYRAALTYEFVPGLNAYVSYSESFQPQLRIDINDRVLAPLSGKQYEIGAKYATPDKRLLVSAAVFDLRQSNQGVYDQQGTDGFDRYRAMGEVRHRGIEFEAVGRITPQWQINTGFTMLDPEISKDDNPSLIGSTITYLPKSTASLFTSYDFNNGFYVSGGARFVDSVKTSYDGSTKDLPGYTLFDAGIGYSIDKWRFQLNGKNLTSKRYYINNYQTTFYGNVVGAPRSVTASVKYAF